jgi:predicted DNA binding CopG/RHH family protein
MGKDETQYRKITSDGVRVEKALGQEVVVVAREDHVKVTLALSKRSLDYFKREAKKRHVPYQRMIRSLVDMYAERQERK